MDSTKSYPHILSNTINKTLLIAPLYVILFLHGCSKPAEPVFVEKKFNLTVITDGEGTVAQRVLNEADYDQRQPKQVELRPQAAENWEFTGWGGDISGSANPLNLALDADKRVTATFSFQQPDCGPVTFTYRGDEVTYGSVISANNRCWLDRNLGASRVATSSTDEQAYGDLFQWGRGDDGHQDRNSPTIDYFLDTDQPGFDDFMIVLSEPFDWRKPQNDNLWQGVDGINNPCPSGYRIPTESEWETERQNWSGSNLASAFNSPLKLTAAGRRSRLDGKLNGVGSYGRYWSSTVAETNSRVLRLENNDVYWFSNPRAGAFSLRCLKD